MYIPLSCIAECTKTKYPTNATIKRNLFQNIQPGDIVKFDSVCGTYDTQTGSVRVETLKNYENTTLSYKQLYNILQDFEFRIIQPTYPDEIQKRLY